MHVLLVILFVVLAAGFMYFGVKWRMETAREAREAVKLENEIALQTRATWAKGRRNQKRPHPHQQ